MKKVTIFLSLILLLCTGCAKDMVQDMLDIVPYTEVTVEDTVFEDKFYFSQLTEEEQQVYKEIYQGVLNQDEEICVHSTEAEKVNSILENVVYDFGEIFWIDGSATSTTYEETGFSESYTVIEPTYVYSLEERTQKEAEIEAVVSEVINGIPTEYTEYETIKYIYEYLINSITYNEDASDSQNIYSALVGKQTVCAGYAKANQYLLNRMGIYCTYVTGTAMQDGEAESHAWNIVCCNGNYYYVDITWADPIMEEEQSGGQMEMLYDYLCCSEDELEDTHVIDAGYEYPECDSNDLEYYRKNQMFYENIDREQLLDAMYKSIDEKAKSTTFKFADVMSYTEGKSLVLNDLINPAAEYLCEKNGLTEMRYYYEEHVVLNKLVIYWFYE